MPEDFAFAPLARAGVWFEIDFFDDASRALAHARGLARATSAEAALALSLAAARSGAASDTDADATPVLLEFGVFRGRSLRMIARRAPAGALVLGFDSFRGLDVDWRAGFGARTFDIGGAPPQHEHVLTHTRALRTSPPAVARQP